MQSQESPRSAGTQAPAYAQRRDAVARGFATQWVVVALFGGTVFLSAFLLFQVQPLIGKRVLPWFGGTPSVWMACMLFFQVMLLAGYAYAHLVATNLPRRGQVAVHLGLLTLALLQLPLVPAQPALDGSSPTAEVLLLLLRSVGLPFLALAATGPLLQSWFAALFPGKSFYRLYALSNVGSLLALVTYPVLVERFLYLDSQAGLWSTSSKVFLVLCALCALASLRAQRRVAPDTLPERVSKARPARLDVLFWLSLAACGSVMLLAGTNQICQNVASVPLLWILPLCLYLLSFILCFDSARWYSRTVFSWALFAVFLVVPTAMALGSNLGLVAQVGIYSGAIFVCCMCVHGELARLKPEATHLTAFYLSLAAGGALGGVFVSVLAPQLFDGYWEFPAGIFACCVMLLLVRRRDFFTALLERQRTIDPRRPALLGAGAVTAVALLMVLGAAGANALFARGDVVLMTRSFYGVLRLDELDPDDAENHRLRLIHGTTVHGAQFLDPEGSLKATTYFSPSSGVGIAIEHKRRTAAGGLRIGDVGLGVGTIAAYAGAGDVLRFYEINPDVVALAEDRFTYLADARNRGAAVDVLLGDGRITLEKQLAVGEPQAFDLLVVDAFSSDAIPVHLLTRECFAVYLAHLLPDGVLVLNVSNHYLELAPVVRRLAELHGWMACRVDDRSAGDPGAYRSTWVLVTRDQALLDDVASAGRCTATSENDPAAPLWTDDYSSLLQVLR